jgi:hypothetical protein
MPVFKEHEWGAELSSVGTCQGTANNNLGLGSYVGGVKHYKMHGEGKFTCVLDLAQDLIGVRDFGRAGFRNFGKANQATATSTRLLSPSSSNECTWAR